MAFFLTVFHSFSFFSCVTFFFLRARSLIKFNQEPKQYVVYWVKVENPPESIQMLIMMFGNQVLGICCVICVTVKLVFFSCFCFSEGEKRAGDRGLLLTTTTYFDEVPVKKCQCYNLLTWHASVVMMMMVTIKFELFQVN